MMQVLPFDSRLYQVSGAGDVHPINIPVGPIIETRICDRSQLGACYSIHTANDYRFMGPIWK